MGYNLNHKGCKCLDPNGRMFISRDVIFDEFSFPFPKIKKSPVVLSVPQIGLRPLATPPVLPHISQLLLGFASSNSQDNPFRTSISTLVPSTQHEDKHLCDMDTSDAIANVDPTHTLETYVSVQPSLSNNIVGLVFAAIEARSLGNTHGMITRAKNGRYKPKIYLAELTEPSSVLVALHQPEYEKAILEEYRALQKNGTRSLVSLLPGRKAIGCKWVFKVKEKPYDNILKYKA